MYINFCICIIYKINSKQLVNFSFISEKNLMKQNVGYKSNTHNVTECYFIIYIYLYTSYFIISQQCTIKV